MQNNKKSQIVIFIIIFVSADVNDIELNKTLNLMTKNKVFEISKLSDLEQDCIQLIKNKNLLVAYKHYKNQTGKTMNDSKLHIKMLKETYCKE
jgi:hypothetical protein